MFGIGSHSGERRMTGPSMSAIPSREATQPLDTLETMKGSDGVALRETIELLFFAYRQFTAEADVLLSRYGFGRAHHRVLYFVGRRPGITVSELLELLRITKQSLARVLGQLMDGGFVVQRTDPSDRRRRRLFLTPEAEALEQALTERQAAHLSAAFTEAGEGASRTFRAVLHAMAKTSTVIHSDDEK